MITGAAPNPTAANTWRVSRELPRLARSTGGYGAFGSGSLFAQSLSSGCSGSFRWCDTGAESFAGIVGFAFSSCPGPYLRSLLINRAMPAIGTIRKNALYHCIVTVWSTGQVGQQRSGQRPINGQDDSQSYLAWFLLSASAAFTLSSNPVVRLPVLVQSIPVFRQ
jgi:hypothetical protein